jgi:hypothetical protein
MFSIFGQKSRVAGAVGGVHEKDGAEEQCRVAAVASTDDTRADAPRTIAQDWNRFDRLKMSTDVDGFEFCLVLFGWLGRPPASRVTLWLELGR